MKKKIGFIDLFIDEWHANNYPAWFATAKRSGEFEVAMAWQAEQRQGKLTQEEWCKKMNIASASSQEEVIEKCDCLCVLAPSNPEVHEELAKLSLQSGKPTYVDKPFAPNRATAERIFDLAKQHNTPLMSSSALRYGDELIAERAKMTTPLLVTTCGGGGNFPEYAIHQIEMIVSLIGVGVKELLVNAPSKDFLTVSLRYADGRAAAMNYAPFFGFSLASGFDGGAAQIPKMSNTFPNLIDAMLDFYATGVNKIPMEETLEIAAILDSCVKGMANPGKWLAVK